MKILSVRQPWASLIAAGHKDIENRTWRALYRGPLLIHASLPKPDAALLAHVAQVHGIEEPPREPRGGIVGIVMMIDCVTASDSSWFEGPFGFVLRNARELPFHPLRGQLSLFDAPEEILEVIYEREISEYLARDPAAAVDDHRDR